MFILVHHQVHHPQRFWSMADQVLDTPPEITLHQTLPASDGTMATCLWEAETVDAVRDFLEPKLGDVSTNRYAVAENRDGIALPSKLESTAGAQ